MVTRTLGAATLQPSRRMRLKLVSRTGLLIFAAAGLLALALWIAIAAALRSAEHEALARADTQGRNLAHSMAEHLASSVRAIDLVLMHLRGDWVASTLPFADHVAQQQENLHRENVDDLVFQIPGEAGDYRRIEEVLDCWFESGSMPYGQFHYPFENKELFEQKAFPADFICEGIDQTRGWFYTMHAIATMLFDNVAYKNLIVNELILDKKGLKMSKSKGNTVDPFILFDKYGADTTQWYLVTNSPP